MTTRSFSPNSRSQRWRGHSNNQSQQSETPPTETTSAEPEERSYGAYIKRIRESKPYWALLDHIHIYDFGRSFPLRPVNPVSVLEVAADKSLRHFTYKTYEGLREHLKTPYIRDEPGRTSTSSQGRRVILVTDLMAPVLEVLGDAYSMDFGFFTDHLLPDEHVSYATKTTRGNHCHVLSEGNPPSRRFQFEYRELSRFAENAQRFRDVRRVFGRPGSQFNWDAIFQRRFSVFSHTPPDGGLITGEGSLPIS